MSLVDQMLNSFTPSARVVSEQHDTNKINYGGEAAINQAGGGRPQEPWDAGEYGMALAEAQQRWDNAQTPEAREKVILELQERALRRASLDVTAGKVSVFVAGKPAWHGLGVNVAEAVNSADAMRLANLDWKVEKSPLYYEWNDGHRFAGGHFGLIRQDTGKCLNHVGPKYTPIQNGEGFSFLDSVLAEYGARYESAGAIYGGSKVWMLAHLPQQRFTVNGADIVEPYVLFTNAHGGEAAWCFPTSVRTECANTFRTASQGKRKGICIRHIGNVKRKVFAAREALGLAVKSFGQFREVAETMTQTKVKPEIYFNEVLDAVTDTTAQGISNGSLLESMLDGLNDDLQRKAVEREYSRRVKRREFMLEDIFGRYEERTNGANGMRGTAWSAWNAVTEHADHATTGRQRGSETERATRRFESIIDGDADDLKQMAYSMAMSVSV